LTDVLTDVLLNLRIDYTKQHQCLQDAFLYQIFTHNGKTHKADIRFFHLLNASSLFGVADPLFFFLLKVIIKCFYASVNKMNLLVAS